MKHCTKCMEIKNEIEFRKKRTGVLRSWCKSCEKIYYNEYRRLKRVKAEKLGLCKLCGVALTSKNLYCKDCTKISSERLKRLYNRKPELKLLYASKARANKKKLPFNIDIADILIPDICPILGIPLEKSKDGYCSPNSPTIDRFIPELGYVKGNIAIISHRANTIKSNATIEEIEKLLEWMRINSIERK